MAKSKRMFLISLVACSMLFMATTAFARTISVKDAGISLWIFLVIGAILILLQLIPAGILFFSFIGSVSTLAFRRGKIQEKKEMEEKEKLVFPGEPLAVQK